MVYPSLARRFLCVVVSLVLVPVVPAHAGAEPSHAVASRAVVSRPLAQRPLAPAAFRRQLVAPAGPTLLADPFTEAASAANAWLAAGTACLTAGTAATPATSIPACGAAAPQDVAGSGALQLTPGAAESKGFLVYRTPLATANGLQITFTDATFDGTTPGADGMTTFLSDASQPLPAAPGALGGAVGYAGSPGVANAYLGIGLDSYGNFSLAGTGQSGGPGRVENTIAVRGAAATSYQYIGGYTNTAGTAASLPFALDTPAATTRPATPPTILEQLTALGVLTVAIDRHDGNGFVTYYTQTIVGVNGQTAVPASVYLGFTGSTGGSYERHLITNLTVTQIGASTSSTDPFAQQSTAPNTWGFSGGACLTAGTSATPATSIPACGANATLDANGQGALQLTAPAKNQLGMVVDETPFSTANGIAVTFTDASFNGSSPGADGMAMFLTDASKAVPVAAGVGGGSLGYGNGGGATGLANAYLGIGFDEYGNFSSTTAGSGGPGLVRESIAVRGAASTGYAYLSGYQNSAGTAASLPFSLDQPTVTTRPANAPTISVALTAAGQLTISIDRHDGNGSVQYYSKKVAGQNGEPMLPASVYVGFSASTGGSFNRHQILGFSVVAAASGPSPTPAPTPSATPPAASFSPPAIPNLQAWYDASNASGVTQANGLVSAWNDLSGNHNTLAQTTASLEPGYTAAGIDNRASLTFNGAAYLTGTNAAFSTSLFNASTVFVVSNHANATQSNSIGWSGAYLSNPRWNLRLSEGLSTFDFNNKEAGQLTPDDVTNGPAIWTAAGSAAAGVQYLRKDGNTLSSSTGPGATATGNYPFVVGATAGSGQVTYQYSGQLGELLVYSRLLTSAETAEVEGYLACKWGLQNRLPANHPYRSTCPQGGSPVSMPYPTPSAGALIDPPQVRSQNGQLVFNVVATQDSSGAPHLTYNGSNVAPTLRLVPGDTLIVNLTNQLPTPPAGSGFLNDTNLHYHGLHVSPNAPGDDSIDMIALPGQSLQYKVAIPLGHPTGLYWYHSHAHGEAERQNLSGMSGALIIDGVSQYAPQVENMPERILIVRDALPAGQALPAADRKQVGAMYWAMQHAARSSHGARAATPPGIAPAHASMNVRVRGASTASTRNPYVVINPQYRHFARPLVADTHCTAAETAAKNWTLNGQTVPTIGIRPGEQQFWRLVNAGSDSYLDLAVDNAQMQIVALDGVPLASVGNTPMTVAHYLVPPASRIEFIVTGPAAGTTAYLRTNCFDAGSDGPAMPAAVLAQLNPNSSLSDAAKLRDRTPKRLARLGAAAVHPLHTAAFIRRFAATTGIARTQTLIYSDQNTINGQSYDPGAPAQFYAQSGTMEQWQIVNNSNQVHTFHIHQVHFLVDQIVGGTAIEQSNVGQVLDNINVPAANANGPGTVTLTMDFTDPLIIGTFLLHCHILSHEDAGMMSKITIGTAPPLTNSAPNGVTFASSSAAAQTVTLTGGKTPYSPSGCAGVASATISGSTVTISPKGAGSCVLTVADSSGLTTTIAITVAGAAPVITVSPNSLSYVSPSAAAQTASISGGTAPYTVAGCSGIATASISGATVSVKPSAAGSCTLSIADSASHSQTLSVTVNAPSSGAAVDNVTFHQNAARQGWYQSETALTTTTVASSKFGLRTTLTAPSGMPAFGKVYAQPLYASAESIGGVKHNLVLIATATDQVYAFDDQTDTVVWERNFTNPAAGITQQLWTDTACADVNPDVGITSTPVLDRARDEMYVVVPTKENGAFHLRLHAISLQSGADVLTPVEVSASTTLATGGVATTSAENNFSRTALLEANGNIYVGLGSHCDYQTHSTHGWLLAYSATNLATVGSALDLTNANSGNASYLGSIWMSGYGPAADASGNVYFATGNGPWNGTTDFAMSILKLPGTLNIASGSYFTPINEATESSGDEDLASGGVMLLPDGLSTAFPHLIVAGGKDGTKYVLNRDRLGGQQTGDAGAVWHAVTGGLMWGGPAFFQDTNGKSYVLYGGSGGLSTYAFTPATGALGVIATTTGIVCLECRNSGSQPIVSSNGTTPGTAVAWALRTPGNDGGTIKLYAFNALTMTTLFSGAAGSWTIGSGATYIAGALVSPLVANGRVYVPTDGSVAVFGLSP